jgi:chromosome segregation ATPase
MSRYSAQNYDWDNNGSVTKDDLMRTFDTNHDGVLDAEELSAFTEQLTSQLEYNNTLLNQIQSLEQNNLVLQKDLHVKQEFLIQNSKTIDSVKEDLAETKRKFKIVQDISENLTRQLRECRLENNLLKKECESSVSNQSLSNLEIDGARKELQSLKRSYLELQDVKQRNEEQSVNIVRELQSTCGVLKNVNESLNNETAEFRNKHADGEAEKKELTAHLNELTSSYQDLRRAYDAECLGRAHAEETTRQLAHSLEMLQADHCELEHELHDTYQRLEVHRASLKTVDSERDRGAQQLAESEEQVLELTFKVRAANEEKKVLGATLERIRGEHSAQLRKLKSDQERQTELVSTKQSELVRLLEESRAHVEEAVVTGQDKVVSLQRIIAESEEKVRNAHRERAELQGAMDKMSSERVAEAQRSDQERSRAAQEVDRLKALVSSADISRDDAVGKIALERETSAVALHAARTKYIECNERYVEVFSAVQQTVAALNQECATNRAQMKDLVSQVVLYKKKACAMGDNHCAALVAGRAELLAAYKSVHAGSQTRSAQIEAARDDSRRHQLAREEEVSKTLSLEEYASRLEHEASLGQKRLAALEKDQRAATAKQTTALEQLAVEKKVVEQKELATRGAWQDSAAKAKALEGSVQQLQTVIAELRGSQSSSRQEVDAKVDQLAGQLRRALEERDEEMRRGDALADRGEAALREVQMCRADLGTAAAQIEALRKENQDIVYKQQQALSSAGGATQQYHTQFKQSQELLKVTSFVMCFLSKLTCHL